MPQAPARHSWMAAAAAAAEDTDGDHVIEVVSAGSLYRGEEWERKYWSCSRGKNRHPYPVGYHTVRHFFGISYTMEIQEGPRGPVFLVTSTEGDSATGPTPDIAWKNFQKKSGAKVRNWQKRRSFPQKIDGAELFGFKNASIQRLLRELIVYATGAVVQKLPCPGIADVASPSSNKDTTDVCDLEGMPACVDKTSRTGKRIVQPSQTESAAKRIHYGDTSPSVGSSSESTEGNVNGGDVSNSRFDRVPDYFNCTSIDDRLEKPSQCSSQQVDLSSSSYLSSEKSDLESAEKEAARFMLSFLLPQAIPFLEKSKKKKKKKSKQKRNNIFTGSLRTASTHKPSDGCCKGATVPTNIDKGTNMNSSDTYLQGEFLCDMIKDGSANDGSANDDRAKHEYVFKLDGMKDIVEDSFEEDVHIWVDNTSRSRGVQHQVSDDAHSGGPKEHSKDEFEVKLNEMKYVVEDSFEEYAHFRGDNTFKSRSVCHDMSDDACSRQPNEHSKYESVPKLDELKDVVEDSFDEDAHAWADNTSNSRVVCHHMSDDACSRQPNEHSKDESVVKLDETKDVEDSFDGARISGDDAFKSRGVHHHVSDVACSREPNKKSKVLGGPIEGHVEPFVSQIDVDDSAKTADVIYDHEKGKYILSDSFLAFLEEEFGGDECPCPENHNQFNSMPEQIQIEQLFMDPTNGMNDGSVSLDVSCHKNVDNGLVDLCGQVQCRYGNEDTIVSVRCESDVCEQISPKVEHTLSHHQHDHAFSSMSDHQLEFVGCYLHPTPVLSIMLNSKNHSNLNICVLCGFLKSFQRFLYIYTITLKDQQDTAPRFVSYTPLLLPSMEQSSTGNFTFERSGLHLTPDGQFVVLMSSIRIPFCRMRNIDCSCCVCKSHQREDNSLKIASVNFGYVSLITKLMPYGTVSCILICEPNYVVAAENNRHLHIWKMVTGWSRTSEDYVIPSLGHAGPSILELRRMSRNSSLIIGHDGAGGFCLWDISTRTLLATFAAPGNIIFQILPVSFCSLQEDMIHAPVGDIEKRLQEVMVSDMSSKIDWESVLMAQREDIAVWVLVSSASVAEYQYDLRAKKHNARWRLGLLTKKRVFMGNILDSRATAVDTSGNYGFAGTYGGQLYMWELSSGRKFASTQCINESGGRVSCIAVDAESGAVAVADDGCQLLVYTQKMQVLPVADEHIFQNDVKLETN